MTRENIRRRRRNARLRMQGLNMHGEPRRKREFPQCAGLPVQVQKNIRARFYTAQLNALGLTKRGTPRVYRSWPGLAKLSRQDRAKAHKREWMRRKCRKIAWTPLDLAWRELRAAIVVPDPWVNTVFRERKK